MTESIDWQNRALAAERTVAVLKRKVCELYNGGGSAIQHTVERAREREAETRRRQELAELRSAELERYSAKLEAEVAARTRDIKVILDNVTFGFLVVGRDGAVREGYTRSCIELLGRGELAGRLLSSVLGFEDRDTIAFDLQLEQLFMDVLPDEIVIDQLPCRGFGAGGNELRLDVRVLRTGTGEIDGALFTITDVTALLAAERENAHYRMLVSILRQREAFGGFIADCRMIAADGRTAVARRNDEAARRAMHTLKGNAACFGLADVARLAHAAEEQAELAIADFDRVEAGLDAFIKSDGAVLGIDDGGEATIRVSTAELAQLETAQSSGDISRWMQRIRRRSVRLMIGPLGSLVERLAARFEKAVELRVEGDDLRVDPEVVAPVVRELGHLVRNALDHGIESPEERGAKPATGHLCLRFVEDANAVRIIVEDDGRGIDVERVVAKAKERGMSDALLASLTHDQRLALIFVDGLTTAKPVTDISGRGIGMSAVRAAVQRAGGTIDIASELGAGTKIDIRLPLVQAVTAPLRVIG